jgi:uncharacterized protein
VWAPAELNRLTAETNERANWMRLFYASDVHGSEKCFRKFLNAARFYDAELLIMGGDLTGKLLVPLIHENGGVHAEVFGKTNVAVSDDEIADLEKRLRFNGFYPLHCSPEEYRRLTADDAYREQTMTRVMTEEVARWMTIADSKLRGTAVRCLVMPGNDDEFGIDDVLRSEVVENPDGRVVRVGDLQVLSSAWANPTPWDSPREAPEERLEEIFTAVAEDLDPDLPTIFNLHVPPYNSGLDLAPGIEDDLRVRTSGGQPDLVPVGSSAVRALIERHQPLLSLHGHIHESRNIAKIGRTICINPGSEYGTGVIHGAIAEVKRGSLRNHQLVSG